MSVLYPLASRYRHLDRIPAAPLSTASTRVFDSSLEIFVSDYFNRIQEDLPGRRYTRYPCSCQQPPVDSCRVIGTSRVFVRPLRAFDFVPNQGDDHIRETPFMKLHDDPFRDLLLREVVP